MLSHCMAPLFLIISLAAGVVLVRIPFQLRNIIAGKQDCLLPFPLNKTRVCRCPYLKKRIVNLPDTAGMFTVQLLYGTKVTHFPVEKIFLHPSADPCNGTDHSRGKSIDRSQNKNRYSDKSTEQRYTRMPPCKMGCCRVKFIFCSLDCLPDIFHNDPSYGIYPTTSRIKTVKVIHR